MAGKHDLRHLVSDAPRVMVVDGSKLVRKLIGDVLLTPVTGAYGYSMASNYNLVPRPAVVFVRDGRARVVVRRETLADLVARDVVPDAPGEGD